MGSHVIDDGTRAVELYSGTLAAAGTVTNTGVSGVASVKHLVAQCKFTYAAGGGTADIYLQTSMDRGGSWMDIANWHFTTTSATNLFNFDALANAGTITPTDGAIADNTKLEGFLGDRFRIKQIVTGTAYSGATTVAVNIVSKG